MICRLLRAGTLEKKKKKRHKDVNSSKQGSSSTDVLLSCIKLLTVSLCGFKFFVNLFLPIPKAILFGY